MKPFSHQRTKRNTTFVTLLVWLFATVSGMANACLLETPAKHLHIALNYSEQHPHSPASTGHTATVDEHDDDLDASRESCLKACDDGANAPVKLQTGVDLTDPGLALFVPTTWNATPSVASVPCGFDVLRVPVVGPPLRVRYSRLTL